MKVSAVFLSAALALASLAPAARAQDKPVITGNTYYQPCKDALQGGGKSSVFYQGACAGMMGTVFWFGPVLPNDMRFCAPVDANAEQGLRVVLAYMNVNPALMHRDFLELATTALQVAWPCR
jgi:hypothetical protein